MGDETETKRERGIAEKLLLITSVLIFIIIGGYSIYKITVQKSETSNDKVAVIPKPTESAEVNTSSLISPSPTPTIEAVITAIPTASPTNKIISPTITTTKIPAPTSTIKPTPTANPTMSLVANAQPSLLPTVTAQKGSLPVSGNSAPTVLLLFLGIILVLPVIFLH